MGEKSQSGVSGGGAYIGIQLTSTCKQDILYTCTLHKPKVIIAYKYQTPYTLRKNIASTPQSFVCK